ncbi:ubiquitin family member protein [Theileria equi strain WA]|uniref:Ubiquitin family member protein n=1 Tax=Theileria equi strain WA TaxID=1537102 RepID=L0AU05_THEEQ|nr:ubiquitin family member protein [Theileria equi strain WA]AFZ79025.1 ubiquitin family member protein [Theileria equi strain WA]|eukprot:XP_004828691.1 ubiquitin family member protein [Theileria equi strain WA]
MTWFGAIFRGSVFIYAVISVIHCMNIKNTKNTIRVNTLYGPLEIRRNIRTIHDVKCGLSNLGYRGNIKLYSNRRQLFDNEVYSESEHSNIAMCIEMRGGMRISIETMTGKSVQIEATENETVLDVKKKLSEKQNIPLEQQRMIYNGKLLEDNKTLAEYNIKNNAVIQLVLRLRGGVTSGTLHSIVK